MAGTHMRGNQGWTGALASGGHSATHRNDVVWDACIQEKSGVLSVCV